MRSTVKFLLCAALLCSLAVFPVFSAPKYIIGMSQCNLGEPWRVQMNADIKAEADKHPEIQVIFKDAQNDVLQQRAQVEEFVDAKINLLIISPKEAQPLAEPVSKAMAAGIPVIVLDRDIIGQNYTEFIGADNVKIGRAVGKWLVKNYGGKHARVVEIMGLQTSTPGQDRHNGFLEAIKGSDLNVIFRADAKWLEPDARREMESALARFDKIDIVYGHNDPSAHGAYLAAQADRAREGHGVRRNRLPAPGGRRLREAGHPHRHVPVPHRRRRGHQAGAEDLRRRQGRQEDRAWVPYVHEGQRGCRRRGHRIGRFFHNCPRVGPSMRGSALSGSRHGGPSFRGRAILAVDAASAALCGLRGVGPPCLMRGSPWTTRS